MTQAIFLSYASQEADAARQLWAETYDRTLDDIFAAQDDIAQSVVKELRTVLMGEVPSAGLTAVVSAQVALSAAARTTSAESHALFMHGRYLIRRFAATDLLEGIKHLRDALDIDSNYALAWAWLSFGLTRAAGFGLAPVHASNTEARSAAERALALNPECVEAHVALFTHELFWGWNWATGLRSAEAAVHLAPNQAEVCAAAALLFGCMGDSDRALRLAQHAVTLDPLSTEVHSTLGQVLAWTDSLAPEAEAAYRKVL